MGIRLCGVGRWRWRRHACQLWCCAATAWGFSCAKVGAPSGGEMDRDPPVVMGHTPATDATDAYIRLVNCINMYYYFFCISSIVLYYSMVIVKFLE